MKYSQDGIRRQDRLLDEADATALLKSAEYGVLSMCDGNQAYGVPLNYVWDGKHSLYIHCAPVGRKLNAIAANPRVSFCVVGRTHLLPAKFTTGYESVVLTGTATADLSDAEKHAALSLLLDKLSPNDKELGEKYAEKSFHRVAIIRMDVEQWSGKSKKV